MNIPGNLLEIYRRIAAGEDKHGDFLTSFAEAVVRADHENALLLLPAMQGLCEKYNLWPGMKNPLANVCVEQLCVRLAIAKEASGAVLVILHHNARVEVVAGLREECPDLAALLQKLADQVKDGDGQPIGEHGHTLHNL